MRLPVRCLGCKTPTAYRLLYRGRCPSCSSAKEAQRDQARGPRPWYGSEHRQARKELLTDDSVCAVCGTSENLQLDHVIPRLPGYQWLCGRHNSEKQAQDKQWLAEAWQVAPPTAPPANHDDD